MSAEQVSWPKKNKQEDGEMP